MLTLSGQGRWGGTRGDDRGGCREGRRTCSDRRGDDGWVDADGQEFLTGEVEGEVLVGLEEAKLADLLRGDAAGGEVGDTTGVEFDANIGDIGFGREDRQTDGADFANGRVGEAENDVEIVDHEVENDVDVEGTGSEDAESMGFEEHGLIERCEGCGDRRIETLEVADGNDATLRLRESQDVVCLGEIRGEGLFDEDVEAGEKKVLRHRGVMDGGYADGCGVEGQVGGEHLSERREGWDVVGRGEGRATLGDRFNERYQLNELRLSDFELAIDAKVIAPEGASANYCDAQRRHGYFCAAAPGSADSTAMRQRV